MKDLIENSISHLKKKQLAAAVRAYTKFYGSLFKSLRVLCTTQVKLNNKTNAFKKELNQYYSAPELQHVFYPKIKEIIKEKKQDILALKQLEGIRVPLKSKLNKLHGTIVITRGVQRSVSTLLCAKQQG